MFKKLTLGFIGALVVIVTFVATDHLPAPKEWMASAFNAITNLSYGYCASYIFYLINIFFPQKNEEEKIASLISNSVGIIRENIQTGLYFANRHATQPSTDTQSSLEFITSCIRREQQLIIELCNTYATRHIAITSFQIHPIDSARPLTKPIQYALVRKGVESFLARASKECDTFLSKKLLEICPHKLDEANALLEKY